MTVKIFKYSKTRGARKITIDAEDAALYQQGSWTLVGTKSGSFYLSHCRNVQRSLFGHQKFHRLVMKAPDNMQVDHISGNTLDNRKQNLRICSSEENKFNSAKRKANKSGYKGVHKYKTKWLAQIQLNKRKIYLGLHETKEKAAEAYNKAALNLFGQFARPNKVVYDNS